MTSHSTVTTSVKASQYARRRFFSTRTPCRIPAIPSLSAMLAVASPAVLANEKICIRFGGLTSALISARVYKPAMGFAKARDRIVSERGKHFDPDVTDVFRAGFEEFVAVAQKYQEGD